MRKILVLFVVLLAFAIVGCSGAQVKGSAVTTYEAVGMAIKGFGETVKPLCDAGTLSATDCEHAKDIYEKARTHYIEAGDLLKGAIEAEDAAKKKDYATAIAQAITVIAEGETFIKSFGGAK